MTKFTSGFALVLFATFALGLVGCGSSDSKLTSTSSSTEDEVASDSTAGDSQDSTEKDDNSPPETESDLDASNPPDAIAQEDADTQDDESIADAADEDGAVQTAQSFVDRIQTAYQNGDISEAVKIAEEAHQTLLEDDQLSMVLLQLLMAQAQSEPDQQLAGVGLDKAEKLIGELASQLDPEQLQGMRMGLNFLQARSRAAAGELGEAIELIKQARENGFPVEHLGNDPVFASLLEDAKFSEILRGWMLEDTREQIAAGESFPFEFSLTTYDDAQTVSLEDQKGKVVIVDFWGTWCGPCKMEIPHFIKLQDKYPDELAIVGINYENGTDEQAKQQIATFVQDMGINYPCVIGDDETQARVPDLAGFPTTLFIDRTGKVRLKVVGLTPYEKLEAIVDVLLAEGKS